MQLMVAIIMIALVASCQAQVKIANNLSDIKQAIVKKEKETPHE